MSRSKNLMALCWRFLLRDWRSGELWLLVLALLMAVSVSTAIALFSDRLQQALGHQVAEVIGADMVIRSPQPVASKVLERARGQQLELSSTLEFPTVVLAGEAMQLVSAKAVEANYPLRGHIRTAPRPFAEDAMTEAVPGEGEAWLEPRLFALLGVDVGDRVLLGEAELTVTRAITLETDRGGSFYSLSPRLLFNMKDVERTRVIQPGSRVSWKLLIAGAPARLEAFQRWSTGHLDASEKLLRADDDRRELRNSVKRLRQFLGLGSMAAVLLAGVAVAMATRRFVERRFDASAIMRCLGAGGGEVLRLLAGELLLVAVLVTLPGMILGWLLQAGLVILLQGVLPSWLPAPGLLPLLVGGVTGFVTLVGFGLAPLLRLQQVSPLRVLRRELVPAPAAAWLVYGGSLATMVALLWYYTGELAMTLILVLASAAVLAVITLGLSAVLALTGRLGGGGRLSYHWRLGLKRIVQERSNSSAQLLAFTLTFLAMAVVLVLRTDLLARWQSELPEQTPNFFAINIQPSELDDYRSFLAQHSIRASELYPVVRGRLIKINDIDVRQAVSKEARGLNALNRELNLTWASRLPEGNTLVQGQWWESAADQGLSVEQELAGKLGITMGDRLTFMANGQTFSQRVTSIRQVRWESFQPNFYMVMPRAVLQNLPASWLNSFYLEPERKLQLNQLVQQFPTVTLLDLDAVINQVRRMVEQSSLAVEAMLGALLLAGLLVMAAVIESGIDQRLQEAALIRSLGGTRRQLLTMQVGEFIAFGVLSGLLAAAGTELCSYWLNTRVFELQWQPVWWLWLMLPVTAAVVLGVVGWLGIRRVIRQSPALVLKQAGG